MPASPALPGEVDGAAVGRLTPELRTLADRLMRRRLLVPFGTWVKTGPRWQRRQAAVGGLSSNSRWDLPTSVYLSPSPPPGEGRATADGWAGHRSF